MPEFGVLLEGDTVLVDTGDGRAHADARAALRARAVPRVDPGGRLTAPSRRWRRGLAGVGAEGSPEHLALGGGVADAGRHEERE